MSREDHETFVRDLYESGDFDSNPSTWFDRLAPDAELVNPAEAVEAGVRHGRDEVLSAWRSTAQAFESARHDLIECHGTGDAVVAWVRFRARARESMAELEQHEAHTWTFRGGEIVRFEWGRDRAEALEAVGLGES
jgi:ketosteroid isomerase-like protein